MSEGVRSEFLPSHESLSDASQVMEEAAHELLVSEGIDGSYAGVLVSDVLGHHGLEGAAIFHRKDPDEQRRDLLALVEDPNDDEQIKQLFTKDRVPNEILEFFRQKKKERTDVMELGEEM